MTCTTPPSPKNSFSKMGIRAHLNPRQSASNFNGCSFHASLSLDLEQFTESDCTPDEGRLFQSFTVG